MTSKSKTSSFADKRSASISTTKSLLIAATGNTFTKSASPSSSKKSTFGMSSFPFRYAYASDGYTPSHQTPASPLYVNSHDYTPSFLLSGRYNSNYNGGGGGGSTSEVEKSEENLFKSTTTNSSSISTSDIDDSLVSHRTTANKIFFIQGDKSEVEAEEEADTFAEHPEYKNLIGSVDNEYYDRHFSTLDADLDLLNFHNLNNQTLPSKLFDEISGLKRYGVRRHHSAPQSDAKWLQVGPFTCSLRLENPKSIAT